MGQEAAVRTGHETTAQFKTEKGIQQDYIYHSAYLTSMRSTSCEIPGWMNHKLESRLPGEISTIRYGDDTTLMAESEEDLLSSSQKVKEAL